MCNYLVKNFSKKFDEIVGFGSIAAWEIVLGNILLVYPSYLVLFYSSKAIGSVLIGIGSDALKRKTVLFITLVIFGVCSLTSFTPQWFGGLMPLPFSLIMMGLLGDPSVVARAVLLDTHIHEISQNRLKCKLLMAKSVQIESFVWIVIGVISYTFNLSIDYFLLAGIGLSALLIVLSKFVIDKTHPDKAHAGIKGMIKECLSVSLLGSVFLLFLLYNWIIETSFFTFFFNVEKLFDGLYEKSTSAMSWSIAMYTGSLLHENLLKNLEERKAFVLGLAISILGLLIYMALYFAKEPLLVKGGHLLAFAIVGLGSGIFLPCFYSVTTSFGRIHSFGFLIGMVDLIRTLAEWVASMLAKEEQRVCFSTCLACVVAFLVAMFLINQILKKKEAARSVLK